jgi:hypothetical protein
VTATAAKACAISVIAPTSETAAETAAKTSGHHLKPDVAQGAVSMAVSVESHCISLMLHDVPKIYLKTILARACVQKCVRYSRDKTPIPGSSPGRQKKKTLFFQCRNLTTPGLIRGLAFPVALP